MPQEEIEERRCPYCGEVLRHPYWRHIQQSHEDQYLADKETWAQLIKDYRAAGMDDDTIAIVVAELFNQGEEDVKTLMQSIDGK